MKGKLKREINLFGALATVMGTVIGAGVFFKTAAVTASTQSTSLTLLAWLLGGFLTICAGLTVAELATAIPETGGAVKYIEAAYGKLPSFLLGWAQSLIYFQDRAFHLRKPRRKLGFCLVQIIAVLRACHGAQVLQHAFAGHHHAGGIIGHLDHLIRVCLDLGQKCCIVTGLIFCGDPL